MKEWREIQRRQKDVHSHSMLCACIETSQGTPKPEQRTHTDEHNKEIKVYSTVLNSEKYSECNTPFDGAQCCIPFYTWKGEGK